MAGRLPGVGLPPRKREHHHRHEHSYRDSSSSSSSSYLRETLNLAEAPCISLGGGGAAMDETALRARHRLQQKLGHFYSSFRSSSNDAANEGKVNQSTQEKKDKGLGKKLLERSWLLRLTRSYKKERKVCAVCLEDFREQEEVMNLSCSHKYHSACLLPWLAAHPHCPYCRTPVQF